MIKDNDLMTRNDIMLDYDLKDYRLYSHIFECEESICDSMFIRDEINSIQSQLEVQGLSFDVIFAISEKLSSVWDNATSENANLVRDLFCTLGWVLGRLAKVSDWNDVYAIIDYVTRIHFSKPAATLVIDSIFDIDSNVVAQSMDWSVLKDIISNYEALKTHPVVVKFIKVITLAFTGGIFATLGIELKMQDIWSVVKASLTKIIDSTDFISALIDLIYFIGERVSAFCVTGSWSTLLHTPSNYNAWIDKAFDLLDKSKALANPQAVGIDYHLYLSDLSNAILEGDEIKRYLRAADEREAVSQVLSRLRILNNDLLIKDACGQMRPAPFGMLISGGSGAGKSSFMNILKVHYAKLYDKPLGDGFVYVRTSTEEHWNSFKTCMWCCILDDVAIINPNKGTEDPSLRDIIHALNNFSFSPPQAAIEDKGRTPFMCELVLASTNTENLMAHSWFNNPQAVRRRLPFIVNLYPKEQYRVPGTYMLDPSTVDPTPPGCYSDLWNIVVKGVTVDKDQHVVTNVIFESDNIYEFIMQFNIWLDEHRRSQASFMASKDAINAVKLCTLHRIPETVCPCETSMVVQAGTTGSVQGAHLSSLLVGGVAAYSTYKTTEFVADCVGEVLSHDETLLQRPAQLVHATTYVMGKRAYMFAKEKYRRMKMYTKEALKVMLANAVYSIYEQYKPMLKKFMMGMAAITSLGLTWKLLQKEFPEFADLTEQVSIDAVGDLPPKREEKENVWKKNDYIPSEFLGRLSQSWSSLELTKAAAIVGRNVVWCKTTHSGTKHTIFRATCVTGHLYVVPHHVLPIDKYFEVQVISDNNSEGCNGNIKFLMSQERIYRCRDKELAFFEIKHMPIRRNLIEAFPLEGFQCDAPGRMIVRQCNGALEYVDTQRTASCPNQFLDQFNICTDVVSSVMVRDTINGECGSPTLVRLPNACLIVGIHVLGGSRKAAVAVPVTQGDISRALKWFDEPIIEGDIPCLVGQNFTTEISPRCTARFIEEGTLEVFGSFGTFKRQPKSTACDTLFTQELLDRGFKKQFGPAPMKGYTALHLGLKDVVQKEMNFKEDLLLECAEQFAHEIRCGLPEEYLEELKSILPMKVALNGMPGTKFLDSMNFSTSAGYPYNKSKRLFIFKGPADFVWREPIVLDDNLKAEVEECWNKMILGVSSCPVFMQHMKDEALPWTKVKAGKARLFMCGPFAWSVCVRMALLPFVRVMQLNKYLFECAPGTNATSIEWTRLYTYLTKFGPDRMIAGDFKAFDKKMGALVILLAFKIIKLILVYAGASDEHLTVISVIAEDVAFSFVNFNGDLMRFFGSNPSGHPLTVIINCIVNSLYMRYCYRILNPAGEVHTFRANVRLITYGDDNAMGSAVDWFNHSTISSTLSSVGIGYTMADKSSASVPFININQVSFLKRSFVWSEELKAFNACLLEESIWKSLMIFIPSTTISPERQCVDIVASAVREWFFYGKERFEKESEFLRDLVNKVGLSAYIVESTFPDWLTLKQAFMDASKEYLSTEPFTTKVILGVCDWEQSHQ